MVWLVDLLTISKFAVRIDVGLDSEMMGDCQRLLFIPGKYVETRYSIWESVLRMLSTSAAKSQQGESNGLYRVPVHPLCPQQLYQIPDGNVRNPISHYGNAKVSFLRWTV